MMLSNPNKTRMSYCDSLSQFMNLNATNQMQYFWELNENLLGVVLKHDEKPDQDLYHVPHVGGEILSYAKIKLDLLRYDGRIPL